jgi:integrase
MKKRKEIPVRNNPGIYKEVQCQNDGGTWVETGRYRAMRRVYINGESKKQQAMFRSLEDARAFRSGTLEKQTASRHVHRVDVNAAEESEALTFEGLVEEWKSFHYLQLEISTKQMYDRRLPHLDFLNKIPVEKIDTLMVDELVKYWVNEHPKFYQRQSFEKELNLLKVILNFYRKRKNAAFIVPVLEEHYRAADVARKPERPVQSLSTEELGQFLDFLKDGINPNYYVLALAQFSFGLRIGEVCGLAWSNLDLQNRVAVIDQVVTWHHTTWEPSIKKRPKNNKVRVLVIPEILAAELARVKPRRSLNVDLVFHRDGVPYSRKDVGKVYNRALEALGIKHVSGTHMMRRTSATLANEATGDFYAVSKLLDHSSPNVTLRYVSQTTASKRKVANALNGVLGNALNGGAENKRPAGN